MKRTVLFSALALATGSWISSNAQIITAPDIGPIGQGIVQLIDQAPLPEIQPGNLGPNQIWDFTDLEGTISQTLDLIDPQAIAAGIPFPESNLGIDINQGEAFLFLQLDQSALKLQGQVGDVGGLGLIEMTGLELPGIDLEVPLGLADPLTLMEFPMQLGEALSTSTNLAFEIIDGVTQDLVTVTRSIESNVSIDASGYVILPGGVLYSAIRLNNTEIIRDSLYIEVLGLQVLLDVDLNVRHTFQWLTDDPDLLGLPLVTMRYDPLNQEADEVSYFSERRLGILDQEASNQQVAVYPIPAREQVQLEVEKPNNQIYFVYDMQGRKMMEGRINQAITSLNVELLAPGTYFIQIVGEGNSQQIKFQVSE